MRLIPGPGLLNILLMKSTWSPETPITATHSINDQSLTFLFVLVTATMRNTRQSDITTSKRELARFAVQRTGQMSLVQKFVLLLMKIDHFHRLGNACNPSLHVIHTLLLRQFREVERFARLNEEFDSFVRDGAHLSEFSKCQ